MKTTYTVNAIFKCSLERAFKTPILGDATKILYGYGPVPPVIGFAKDETWGKKGGSRIPIMKGNWMIKGGEFGFDEIFERDENKYWKWGVSKLGPAMFFATHNTGEWWCTNKGDGTVIVKWTYTYFSRNLFTHPLSWVFVKTIWGKVMRNGMKSIQLMAEKEYPYLYE